MTDKTKNIVVIISFFSLIIIVFVANLIKKDTEISLTERRKLEKLPNMTITSILDGSFSDKFERYTTDQIVKREEFRKLKSMIELDLFRKKDNNLIYKYNNRLIKIEYPLNEESIINAITKINEIKNRYLSNMECYYSIIPDKNYFTDKNKYICMDYEKLQNIMLENINNIKYINIFSTLKLEDYYVTDIHWKQENLQNVVYKISKEMEFEDRLTMPYEKQQITEFTGQYASEFSTKTETDCINILTNEAIDSGYTYNYENKKITQIYDMGKLNSNDKYDIYLSGNTPLIKIINTKSKTNKELIVFRDSFASSLIPLFTEAYSTITLVDIRYIRSQDLEKYIEFKNQDVLFLYSTLVLNNSAILK